MNVQQNSNGNRMKVDLSDLKPDKLLIICLHGTDAVKYRNIMCK